MTLGWVHPGKESTIFGESKQNLRMWDLCNSRRVDSQAPEIHIQCADGKPVDSRVDARNHVVGGFLNQSPADWLLWLDTDMGFGHTLLDQLLASADADTRPVVGALCFAGARLGQSSFGGHRSVCMPTVYDAVEDDERAQFSPRLDYDRDALVECSATGSACVLVHRKVFEAIRDKWGPTWYRQITHPKAGNTFGEDLSFCIRVRECGFPIFVDTSIKTTHDKGWAFLDEELFDEQQGNKPRTVIRTDKPPTLSRAERRRLARAK